MKTAVKLRHPQIFLKLLTNVFFGFWIKSILVKPAPYGFSIHDHLRGFKIAPWGKAERIGSILPAHNNVNMALLPFLFHSPHNSLPIQLMRSWGFQFFYLLFYFFVVTFSTPVLILRSSFLRSRIFVAKGWFSFTWISGSLYILWYSILLLFYNHSQKKGFSRKRGD